MCCFQNIFYEPACIFNFTVPSHNIIKIMFDSVTIILFTSALCVSNILPPVPNISFRILTVFIVCQQILEAYLQQEQKRSHTTPTLDLQM